MKKILIVATLVFSTAFAHDGATGVIAERMDAMSAIGDANKSLSGISRGRTEFSMDLVKESALAISQHSGQGFVDLFPEGSTDDISDAKVEIWQNWDDFTELSLSLESAAISLSNIGSEEEFSTAYKAVSETCSSCHRNYRAKR
jgi:cytochrome c556